jgi:hypothetical protein
MSLLNKSGIFYVQFIFLFNYFQFYLLVEMFLCFCLESNS